MPLIQVKLIEGVFTESQKRAMIQKLTDAMVSVEGEAMRPVTWVTVEEVKGGDWGIGGKPMTAADVKALAPSQPPGERAATSDPEILIADTGHRAAVNARPPGAASRPDEVTPLGDRYPIMN